MDAAVFRGLSFALFRVFRGQLNEAGEASGYWPQKNARNPKNLRLGYSLRTLCSFVAKICWFATARESVI